MLENELLEIQAQIDVLKENMIAKRSDAFIQFVNRKRGIKHSNKSVKNMIAGKSRMAKPVNCYDEQGQLITTYQSIREGCRAIYGHTDTSGINYARKNKSNCKGYYWVYAPYKNNIADEINNKIDGRTLSKGRSQIRNAIKLNDQQLSILVKEIIKEGNKKAGGYISTILRERGYMCSLHKINNIKKQIKNK
jgi:hypothetical protein